MKRIHEEVAVKDQRIREMEINTHQLLKDLEYYKIEYHRMEVLIGVIEDRRSDTNPLMHGKEQKPLDNAIADCEKERWIPPTGFLS